MEDELNLLGRRLTQLAATDGLTGLTNRRSFDGFLARNTRPAARFRCCCSISKFKGYNDTYGHQAGDRCLQAVAKVIGDATSNTSGLSARYGGEEFAVVLPNVSEDDALKVAEAIRLTVRALGLHNTAATRGTSASAPPLQRGPVRRSARPRWSARPTSRSTRPSVWAATVPWSMLRSSCDMSRPAQSSTIRNSRPPNATGRITPDFCRAATFPPMTA